MICEGSSDELNDNRPAIEIEETTENLPATDIDARVDLAEDSAYTHSPVSEFTAHTHRPRNVDWKRAAALLYGDWGTSKAYVIGLAFAAAGFASMPIILAVCALTAIVGFNYVDRLPQFPRRRRRLFRRAAAEPAARRGRRAAADRELPRHRRAQRLGGDELFRRAAASHRAGDDGQHPGPRRGELFRPEAQRQHGHRHGHSDGPLRGGDHRGECAALDHGLSGKADRRLLRNVGAVCQSDPGAERRGGHREHDGRDEAQSRLGPGQAGRDPHRGQGALHRRGRSGHRAPSLLGWAMLSLPHESTPVLVEHKEDMLRFLGEHFATLSAGPVAGPTVGPVFGWIVGIVFGVLLLSAVNTSIIAVIGVIYMMALDGEFPRPLTQLNRYGVPTFPLILAAAAARAHPHDHAGFRRPREPVRHRSGRRDHGQSQLLLGESEARHARVGARADERHLGRSCRRLADHRLHDRPRAFLRHRACSASASRCAPIRTKSSA